MLPEHVGNIIKETSITDCFLKDEYKNYFKKYFYGNFSEIFNDDYSKYNEYTKTAF